MEGEDRLLVRLHLHLVVEEHHQEVRLPPRLPEPEVQPEAPQHPAEDQELPHQPEALPLPVDHQPHGQLPPHPPRLSHPHNQVVLQRMATLSH